MRKLPLAALVLVVVVAALPAAAVARTRAASVKVALPAPGAVTVALGTVKGKVGRVTVARAPRGVIVTGGAKKGTLALAVAVPRRAGARAAAVGSVVVRLAGRGAKPKVGRLQVARDALARPPGRPAACGSGSTLAALLGHSLRGAANGLGGALAARLCGGALDAAAIAALKRLGLDVPVSSKPPATGPVASTSPPPTPAASGATGGGTATGGSSGGASACANGIDDDGDGQIDARGAGGARPDPGCTDAADASEDSERPLPSDCAKNLNAGGGAGQIFFGINGGCGNIRQALIDLDAPVKSCSAAVSNNNWTCSVVDGNAVASGPPTDLIDIPADINGTFTCAEHPVLVLTLADGTVEEGAPPPFFVNGVRCGDAGAPKAACANGADDDGDGQVDAVSVGGPDPDPGCTDAADTSEGSEEAFPQTCARTAGFFANDQTQPFFYVSGCGSVTGVWIRTPAAPASCEGFTVQNNQAVKYATCDVRGHTAVSRGNGTSDPRGVAPKLTQAYQCGQDVTVVVERDGASTIELTGQLC